MEKMNGSGIVAIAIGAVIVTAAITAGVHVAWYRFKRGYNAYSPAEAWLYAKTHRKEFDAQIASLLGRPTESR
jgi:hypothetical protein